MTQDEQDGAQSRRVATMGLEDYLRIPLRRWRIVLVFTFLGALLAGIFLVLAPQKVTATTTINLNVITTEPFSTQSAASKLLDNATETAIAQSQIVANRASEALDGQVSAQDIRRSSMVSSPSGVAVVTVEYTAASETAAVRGADAVAEAYLSFRSQQADEKVKTMVSQLDDQIRSVNRRNAGQEALPGELDSLLAERSALLGVDTSGGIVLTGAEDNAKSYSPAPALTLLTGIAAGAIIGIAAAFLRNSRDKRLRSGADLSRRLDAPVLATVIADADQVPAEGPAADALRVARERLLAYVQPGQTIAVLDATCDPDASPISTNLAILTAQSGQPVNLVFPEATAEFTKQMRSVLKLRGTGSLKLTSKLIGNLRYFGGSNLGRSTQGDALVSPQMRASLQGETADAITFVAAGSSAKQASILMALRTADAALLVAQVGYTTSTQVQWLLEEADGVGTPFFGAIAQDRPKRRHKKPAQDPAQSVTTAEAKVPKTASS